MKTKDKKASGRSRAALPGGKTVAKPRKRGNGSHKKGSRRPYSKFGLPVREGEKDLVIPLLQVDVEAADKFRSKDVNSEDTFLCCVIAQAVTRACGAERVWIGRVSAYVAFPGKGYANHYRIPVNSRRTLEAWDKGEDIKEGVDLLLKAPSKSRTHAAMAEHIRKHRSQHKRGTKRRQRRKDALQNVIRNGNLVRWA